MRRETEVEEGERATVREKESEQCWRGKRELVERVAKRRGKRM